MVLNHGHPGLGAATVAQSIGVSDIRRFFRGWAATK
jgi:hypothetical protein